MTEEFLQYVWANSLFTSMACVSTKGKRVEILNVGFQNRLFHAVSFCVLLCIL